MTKEIQTLGRTRQTILQITTHKNIVRKLTIFPSGKSEVHFYRKIDAINATYLVMIR